MKCFDLFREDAQVRTNEGGASRDQLDNPSSAGMMAIVCM